MKTPRYRPNSGWLNVQLSSSPDAKLREMAAKTRLTLTVIVENALEREHAAWKASSRRAEGTP